jgi:anti-sigma regulatory factor (Ser/Thr protein kinase)
MTAELTVRVALPATPAQLRNVREIVRSVAVAAGTPGDRVHDVVLAVSEACANVVAHAYGPEGGDMHLLIDRRDSDLLFVITDSGKPVIDKRPTGAGFGLGLIRALADTVTIEGPGDSGTVVTITFAIPAD